MGNIFNDDFRDFILALNEAQVEYVLLGGYAVNLHGYRRSTGDMDIWVKPTNINYARIVKAFTIFGLPTNAIAENDFLSLDFDVFSFGQSPVSIDIMTQCKGLEFDTTYTSASWVNVEGLDVKLISLNNLIEAKKISNRYRDLDDIDHLTKK